MLSEDLKTKIDRLVGEELARANKKFPLFASNHEAYAVILEEHEGVFEDLVEFDKNFELLWEAVRHNYNEYEVIDCLKHMLFNATNAACEIIQLCAMCQKAIDSEERNRKKNVRKNNCD